MANQWALLIGINQYPALQPLMYAQADAVGLRNFFVDEVGLPVNHCILLTDLSAAIEPYAHYPLRETLRSQLLEMCQERVQPEDMLWVFFSGYGLSEGGQDYLLAIDSTPDHLAESAISLAWVLDTLKAAPTPHVLLALDMSHSQGATGHHNLGQQTLALAKDFEIPILLACQPQQYSHETMAVRHGLFAQAILEGLRYHGCVTASQLAAYVSDRVPELSQHHWRPQQNPVAVIPAAEKFMMVVPAEAIATLPMTEKAEADQAQAFGFTSPAMVAAMSPETIPPDVDTPEISAAPLPPLPADPARSLEKMQPVGTPSREDAPNAARAALWNWGILGAALVLLLGVLARYQPFLRGTGQTESADTTEVVPADPESMEVLEAEDPAAVEDPAAEVDPDPTTLQPTPENLQGITPEPEPPAPLPAASAVQWAEAAISAERYGEARAWLDLVAPEQQDEAYQQLRQQAEGGTAQAAERNQTILNEARRQIQPISASLFNNAIETARQIPPADPYYEQAQADIDRWSRIILDLAEGRAATGDLAGAIAAAQLVPPDRPAVYRQAQENIARWQQQSTNRQLIQQAQASLQPGQASSFQKAIEQVRQITPDQPEYATAQERVAQWSEDILVIARARAAQSRFSEAISAAQLVPSSTPVHDQAQQEIQRWQGQI